MNSQSSETVVFVLAQVTGSQPQKSNAILLDKYKAYSCGRSRNNDIYCNCDRASRKHCVFYRYPKEVYVKNFSSGNGLFVNGKRLEQDELVKLNENDLIGIGTRHKTSDSPSKLIFRLQKQVIIDVESQCPDVLKRYLEPEYPPSKCLKFFDNSPLPPIKISSTENFGSSSIKFNIENSISHSRYSRESNEIHPTPSSLTPSIKTFTIHDDDIQFVTEVINNKMTLASTSQEASDDSDSDRTVILNKIGTINYNNSSLIDREGDTYESQNTNGNESQEIQNSTVHNDTDIGTNSDANHEPEILDLVDSTDSEEELPLDEIANGSNDSFASSKVYPSGSEEPFTNSRDHRAPREPLQNLLINTRLEGFNLEANKNLLKEPIIENETLKKGERKSDSENSSSENESDSNSTENNNVGISSDVNLKLKDLKVVINQVNVIPSQTSQISQTSQTFVTEMKPDEVMAEIVEWNPCDFQKGKRGKFCAPVLKKGCLEDVLKSYKNYEDYCRVLVSHLLFDVANKVEKALRTMDKYFNNKFEKCDVIKNSAKKIQIAETNSYLLNFIIYIKVSKISTYQIPLVGDLVLLEISSNGCKSNKCLCFGYMKDVSTISTGNYCTQIILTVVTKFLEFDIYTSKILDLRIITDLSDSLNLVQAMAEFKSSCLMPLMMNPGLENHQSDDPLEPLIMSPSSRIKPDVYYFSRKQLKAVTGITKIIESQEPKICIIEGAPGTGKTTVLVDIIANVFCNKEKENNLKQKILVCAKSKAEVDEIVFKLGFVKEKLNEGKDLKIVRVGDLNLEDPRVKKMSLQVLAKRHIELGIRDFLLSKEVEGQDERKYDERLKLLNADYNALEIPSQAIKIHILESCFKVLQKGKNVREMDDQELSNLTKFVEEMLLLEANVIVSTLGMCLSDKWDVFRRKAEIAVCIIDEATLIPEIEILKPLNFGVKILVLLGDPFKTPLLGNSFGKVIKNRKLNNSLFSRIKLNYDGLESSPRFKLDHQYRINVNVVYWLNKFIFEEKMKIGFPTKRFPLMPYKVFNLYPYCYDGDDSQFAVTLITCIVQYANLNRVATPLRIGLILPVADSKVGITLAINASLSSLVERREMFSIDVDTISNFKNQERDIIIVPCTKKVQSVEEYVSNEWLYSAISRVKHSLIIFGYFKKNMKPSLLTSLVKSAKPKYSFFSIKNPSSLSLIKECLIRKRI